MEDKFILITPPPCSEALRDGLRELPKKTHNGGIFMWKNVNTLSMYAIRSGGDGKKVKQKIPLNKKLKLIKIFCQILFHPSLEGGKNWEKSKRGVYVGGRICVFVVTGLW